MQEAQAAVCPILVLDVSAIHLDVLGLVVDLAPISLDISAVPGQGNLLCAVATLLNGTGGGLLAGLLAQINQLLQNILAIIGTL